tara:strand:+ start:298 stop:627 length:330 start_codon:yes stop_codon:yes gene_type:complete
MINSYLKNICLISFALFAPIYLPAGGIQKNLDNLCCFNKAKEIVLDSNCDVYVIPDLYSKKLRYLKTGSTLLVLRNWITSNGDRWLRVQASNNIFVDSSNKPLRGWIKV